MKKRRVFTRRAFTKTSDTDTGRRRDRSIRLCLRLRVIARMEYGRQDDRPRCIVLYAVFGIVRRIGVTDRNRSSSPFRCIGREYRAAVYQTAIGKILPQSASHLRVFNRHRVSALRPFIRRRVVRIRFFARLCEIFAGLALSFRSVRRRSDRHGNRLLDFRFITFNAYTGRRFC